MKTLLFGQRGFLAGSFLHAFPNAIGSDADIADPHAVVTEINRFRPDVLINCAGKTGRPNVDWCEEHQEETLRSNVFGPLVLLDACVKRDIYFVHLGSGCVYDGCNGGRGFSEDDEPNFFGSYYSRTKIWSDQILRDFPVLVLRLRMPFDDSLHARSLFGKLVRYQQVIDAPNSLTYIPDLVRAARQLIEERCVGIYHVVNPGIASPYRIMQRYAELVDPDHRCSRLTPTELNSLTRARRCNCVLSSEKLAQAGIRLRSVDEAIDLALKAIANSRSVGAVAACWRSQTQFH